MASIRQANVHQDRTTIRELFSDYLGWVGERLGEEYGLQFDVMGKVEEDMVQLNLFLPPSGRLLLAIEGERPVGIGCLRKSREDVGEIKRMYVRPEFRRRGIGHALLDALMAEAGEMGYWVIRLDSPRFMDAAHARYRSAGFHPIEPYAETEIPPEAWQHWVFMEKELGQGVAGGARHT